jgi:hypothetical protein
VGTTDAETDAVVESAATMTAAVTTSMGSHVVSWDETERQGREQCGEDFGSSSHDSLRFKLSDAVRN